MLNKSEQLAYDWLLTQGYKKEQIIKNHRSPDFICSDGQRFEVKLIYGKNIVFYTPQIKQLKDEDTILVFDRKGLMINKFKWGNRTSLKQIAIKIYDKKGTMIIVPKTLAKKLKELKLFERETYDMVINRLLDKSEGKKI
jgi:hypothetical protein